MKHGGLVGFYGLWFQRGLLVVAESQRVRFLWGGRERCALTREAPLKGLLLRWILSAPSPNF